MVRTSRMGSLNGDLRPSRSRRHGGRSINWMVEPETTSDSLSYTGDDEVHSSPRRTTSRRQRQPSSSRTVDQNDYPHSTIMAPPTGATLGRAATDRYRRPVNCLSSIERYEVPVRKHSTRSASPGYRRTRVGGDYSARSSVESGLAYGGDDGGGSSDSSSRSDDDHIEVVEEVEEEPSRYRRVRYPSRDDYMDSSSDRRYHRRRRPAYVEEDSGPRRHYPASDAGSAAYASSRTLDRSVESRQGRRSHAVDVIENSRPPISSKRSLAHRGYRSAEAIQVDQSRPRRSSTIRSSRSRAVSISDGSSCIISTVFGVPLRRQGSFREANASRKRVECVICMEYRNPAKVSKLKCGHSMCRSCLERVFKLSITDPQHMPPRCCTQDHIPLKHVDRLFDTTFKKTWNRKFAEFSTRNRIYCPSRKCGQWIKPANIRREDGHRVAHCSRCRTKVCASCSGRWHGAGACPSDTETANLLAQAKKEGWKRCYRCKTLVELKEGCNHMTCRCGAEFCMICGVKWRNCDCPWFNEDHRRSDFLDDLNSRDHHIRGDLSDISHGNGPPAPAELRGHTGLGHSMVMPIRQRPQAQAYEDDLYLRGVQESRDADMARHVLYSGDYHAEPINKGGILEELKSVGNTSGHFMNEDYRRDGCGGGRHRHHPTQYDRTDFEDAYRSRGFPAAGLMYSARVVPPGPPPPVPVAPQGQTARPMRHYSLEANMYNSSPYTPRSERVVGRRISRDYEDEAKVHSPPRSRRRRREDKPRSSDLAGLSGPGTGMNRVSQWRTYVEPGAPDDESTVGHT